MSSAKTSLPVPLSPSSRTVIVVGATTRTTETSSRISSLAAMICSGSGTVRLRGSATSGRMVANERVGVMSAILSYLELLVSYREFGSAMNRLLRAIFAVVFVAGLSSLALGQNFAKGYDVISYNATVKLDRQTDSLWGAVIMTGRAERLL